MATPKRMNTKVPLVLGVTGVLGALFAEGVSWKRVSALIVLAAVVGALWFYLKNTAPARSTGSK